MKFGKDGDDEFLEEIREMVIQDRDKLKGYYYGFLELADSDITIRVGAAETIAKLADSLVKTNSQLIEIAKIKAKKSNVGVPAYGSPEERENLLDEIEGQEIYSAEEDVS